MDKDIAIDRALKTYYRHGKRIYGSAPDLPSADGKVIVTCDGKDYVVLSTGLRLLAVCAVQPDGQVVLLAPDDWPAAVVDEQDPEED